jgi:hypothetical protein
MTSIGIDTAEIGTFEISILAIDTGRVWIEINIGRIDLEGCIRNLGIDGG